MPILPLAWLILELMLAHLGALARHLASLVRHLGADMANNSTQNAFVSQHHGRQPPRCLSHVFFSLSSHGTKINQKCPQNRLGSSQVESKMAILPLAWLILKVSWPIWVATYAQASAIFALTLLEFNQITPCTRRKKPKILSAFNLPRFSILFSMPRYHLHDLTAKSIGQHAN